MIRPADCPHREATFDHRRENGRWAYRCAVCGLVAVGDECWDALEKFARKAEEERARSIFLASF